MFVESIDVYHLALPIKEVWRTGYGEDETIETVLVAMHGEGATGWGESTPFAAPCYSNEWAGGVFAMICKWLAPQLVGKSVSSGDSLQEQFEMFKGNQFAKAALDNAWWVLEANLNEKSLAELIEAKRTHVELGADFSVLLDLDLLMEKISQTIDQGFSRIKLKYRPDWDIHMVNSVRKEFPEFPFHIDCNGHYDINESIEMFCRLDDFDLMMIEQPLAYDDLLDHARLAETIQTPICLDESITSLLKAEQAIELQSCSWINIKPGRVGGLTNALAIYDLCESHGVNCWVGSMLESGIGMRMNLALAAKAHCQYPGDIFPSTRFYHEELATEPLELANIENAPACMEVPKSIGIGVEPQMDLLEKYCIQKASFTQS